jgi:plasmid stability protein
MNESKRTTLSFDADVHRVLRLRAAAWHRLTSKMANEAVRMIVAKAADDLNCKSKTK